MTVHMPHQLFINGEFVDSSSGRTFGLQTDVLTTFYCLVV